MLDRLLYPGLDGLPVRLQPKQQQYGKESVFQRLLEEEKDMCELKRVYK